jgi:hypothetical protein
VHVTFALQVIQIEENAIVAYPQTELARLASQWPYITLKWLVR